MHRGVKVFFHDACFDGTTSAALFTAFYRDVIDRQVDVKPIGMIQGSGFGISSKCPDPANAFANIMKITTPEVIAYVGENRGTVPSLEESFDGWAKGKPEADVEVMKALLADGLPLITTGDWNQFVTVFTQYSSDGTRGNKTAEEILGTIQTSVG